MGSVLLTNLKHGEPGGKLIEGFEGEPVPKGLPADVVKRLRAEGAIGEEAEADEALLKEKEELQARVKELEARLKAKDDDEDAAPGQLAPAPAGTKKV
jgi:hypothetical protein